MIWKAAAFAEGPPYAATGKKPVLRSILRKGAEFTLVPWPNWSSAQRILELYLNVV